MRRFLDLFQRTFTYEILRTFVELLVLVLPYFIAGVLLLALLLRFRPEPQRLALLKRGGLPAAALAALLGAISPFGTYIIAPLGALLIRLGFSAPAVFAFLVASPLINPNLFILTAGVLGLPLALARTASAWLLGTAAGLLASRWPPVAAAASDSVPGFEPDRGYLSRVWAHTRYMGRFFLLALLISAAVRVLVPARWISAALGADATLSLLIAVALGVPFYSCGGAAVPLIRVLVDMGMAPGPVLAFFIAGPATKLSTLVIYKGALGWRALALFLTVTLFGALLLGMLYGGIM